MRYIISAILIVLLCFHTPSKADGNNGEPESPTITIDFGEYLEYFLYEKSLEYFVEHLQSKSPSFIRMARAHVLGIENGEALMEKLNMLKAHHEFFERRILRIFESINKLTFKIANDHPELRDSFMLPHYVDLNLDEVLLNNIEQFELSEIEKTLLQGLSLRIIKELDLDLQQLDSDQKARLLFVLKMLFNKLAEPTRSEYYNTTQSVQNNGYWALTLATLASMTLLGGDYLLDYSLNDQILIGGSAVLLSFVSLNKFYQRVSVKLSRSINKTSPLQAHRKDLLFSMDLLNLSCDSILNK